MLRKLTFSTGLISFVALFTAISPFLADFNSTHVYNTAWPGHARFHNGQTMTTGLLCGLLSLYFLWFRTAATALENLKLGTLFAAFYWLAMAPAILYPGTTLNDPLQGGRPTDYIFGFAFTQLHLDAIILVLLVIGYRAAAKRLRKLPQDQILVANGT